LERRGAKNVRHDYIVWFGRTEWFFGPGENGYGVQLMRVGKTDRIQRGDEHPLPGRAGYDKPGVWVFPKVLVCLNCGASVFALPEAEQRVLEAGAHSN